MSTENTPSTVTINEHKASNGNGNGNGNGNSQGSSTKAFAGVISLLLVIAGVYAMMKPMNQNLDYMRQDIKELKSKMDADDMRERLDQGSIAGMNEKFVAVNSKFVGLREIMNYKDIDQTKHLDQINKTLSEAMLEIARIKECLKMKTN